MSTKVRIEFISDAVIRQKKIEEKLMRVPHFISYANRSPERNFKYQAKKINEIITALVS